MQKIKIKGQEYVLRFDFGAMENMEEVLGIGVEQALRIRPDSGKMISTLINMLLVMNRAACEYLKDNGREELALELKPETIKSASPNMLKKVKIAIEAAIKDGMFIQRDDDDDDEVKDDYTAELDRMDHEKN